MSGGTDADPGQRAHVLLLRAESIMSSGVPESLDEAVLALEGAQDVASVPGVDPELRRTIESRLAEARGRRDGEEPEPEAD